LFALAPLVLLTGLLFLLQAAQPLASSTNSPPADTAYNQTAYRSSTPSLSPVNFANLLLVVETVIEEKDDRRTPSKSIDSYAHFIGFKQRSSDIAIAGAIKSTTTASIFSNPSLPLFLTTARLRL
jgi:hypothetical protein